MGLACAPSVASKSTTGTTVAAEDSAEPVGGDTSSGDNGNGNGSGDGETGTTGDSGGSGTTDDSGGSGTTDGTTDSTGGDDGTETGGDDGTETGGDDGTETGGDDGTETDGCTIAVPAGANVYTGNATSSTAGEWALVCGSGTVSFSGTGVSVAVLSGAGVVIGGSGSEVWLEGSADIANLSDGLTLHTTSSARVVDNGTNTVLDTCDEVVIDTSAVDTSGC
jgi:hypothetical protein